MERHENRWEMLFYDKNEKDIMSYVFDVPEGMPIELMEEEIVLLLNKILNRSNFAPPIAEISYEVMRIIKIWKEDREREEKEFEEMKRLRREDELKKRRD